MGHDSVISACDMALPLNPLVVFFLLLFWGGVCYSHAFPIVNFLNWYIQGGFPMRIMNLNLQGPSLEWMSSKALYLILFYNFILFSLKRVPKIV